MEVRLLIWKDLPALDSSVEYMVPTMGQLDPQ
jgi:hypothetical protein